MRSHTCVILCPILLLRRDIRWSPISKFNIENFIVIFIVKYDTHRAKRSPVFSQIKSELFKHVELRRAICLFSFRAPLGITVPRVDSRDGPPFPPLSLLRCLARVCQIMSPRAHANGARKVSWNTIDAQLDLLD